MPAHLTLTVPVRRGRLNPTSPQKLAVDGFLSKREGKDVVVRLSPPATVRSGNQNRYLWGVVYELIAESTGHTAEEVHEACKSLFLPREFLTVGGKEVEVAKSTAKLTTAEFEKYLEQLRAWAADELGIRLPLPNED